jgi:hypothetical protein
MFGCGPTGSRTMGRPDMMDPTGDAILSLAMEDLLLMAMLGEYMLPLYMLVRRLEKPPIDPRPLPLPRPMC